MSPTVEGLKAQIQIVTWSYVLNHGKSGMLSQEMYACENSKPQGQEEHSRLESLDTGCESHLPVSGLSGCNRHSPRGDRGLRTPAPLVYQAVGSVPS